MVLADYSEKWQNAEYSHPGTKRCPGSGWGPAPAVFSSVHAWQIGDTWLSALCRPASCSCRWESLSLIWIISDVPVLLVLAEEEDVLAGWGWCCCCCCWWRWSSVVRSEWAPPAGRLYVGITREAPPPHDTEIQGELPLLAGSGNRLSN